MGLHDRVRGLGARFRDALAGILRAIAAWLPAIFGRNVSYPGILSGRWLFGLGAGVFAALWIAFASRGFVWFTHLGLADHHAEGFFAFVSLALVCPALDRNPGRDALCPVAAAGCAMGAFLAVRPTGVFVPAILAGATVLGPLAASVVLTAVFPDGVVFLRVTAALWADYGGTRLPPRASPAAGTMGLSRPGLLLPSGTSVPRLNCLAPAPTPDWRRRCRGARLDARPASFLDSEQGTSEKIVLQAFVRQRRLQLGDLFAELFIFAFCRGFAKFACRSSGLPSNWYI